MFQVGPIWENLYAHVDAITDDKKTRAKRALNAALYDILPRTDWTGYAQRIKLLTLANGTFYMPADMASMLNLTIVEDDYTYVADAKFVRAAGIREPRFLDGYRVHVLAATGQSFPWKKAASDVTLTQDSAVIDTVSGDYLITPSDSGGWIHVSGELNLRQVSTATTLSRVYAGATKTAACSVNPNRQSAKLFLPDSSDRNDATAAGKYVLVEYTRRAEDLTHEDDVVALPSTQALEYRAAAKVLRWEKRREDAQHYERMAEEELLQAITANMDYRAEHSPLPFDWYGNPLGFGAESPDTEGYSPIT